MNAVSHISDGLLEKDKKNVNNVAKLVATVVNCQYTLKRHMWNDISDEWPFYTDQERALFRYWIFSKQKFRLTKKRNMDALSIECYGWMQSFKVCLFFRRNKPQNLTPPLSDGSSSGGSISGLSSSSSRPASPQGITIPDSHRDHRHSGASGSIANNSGLLNNKRKSAFANDDLQVITNAYLATKQS